MPYFRSLDKAKDLTAKHGDEFYKIIKPQEIGFLSGRDLKILKDAGYSVELNCSNGMIMSYKISHRGMEIYCERVATDKFEVAGIDVIKRFCQLLQQELEQPYAGIYA
jgi:hypothetical protein